MVDSQFRVRCSARRQRESAPQENSQEAEQGINWSEGRAAVQPLGLVTCREHSTREILAFPLTD